MWGYRDRQNRIIMEKPPKSWNDTDMAWQMLPALKRIYVEVVIMDEGEGSEPTRDPRLAETGTLIRELKQFIGSVNPGVRVSIELHLEVDTGETVILWA